MKLVKLVKRRPKESHGPVAQTISSRLVSTSALPLVQGRCLRHRLNAWQTLCQGRRIGKSQTSLKPESSSGESIGLPVAVSNSFSVNGGPPIPKGRSRVVLQVLHRGMSRVWRGLLGLGTVSFLVEPVYEKGLKSVEAVAPPHRRGSVGNTIGPWAHQKRRT